MPVKVEVLVKVGNLIVKVRVLVKEGHGGQQRQTRETRETL
ncbi:hypothetical protein [Fischerella thermalis]|nr:hypothetical protein [Fischerella thermalis]